MTSFSHAQSSTHCALLVRHPPQTITGEGDEPGYVPVAGRRGVFCHLFLGRRTAHDAVVGAGDKRAEARALTSP